MNVFVLCTGRCGSLAFVEACKHIENYSCAHESRTSLTGADRLAYPDNHIEADNRLSWILGRLDRTYGDTAFYVHLRRNDIDTARSLMKRYSRGIMRAYRRDGIMMGLKGEDDPMTVSLDYCDTVNSNITLFLKDKTRTASARLENIKEDFARIWEMIGAQGDLEASLGAFDTRHNATPIDASTARQESSSAPLGVYRKAKRLVKKFPEFVRNA